MSYLWQFTVDDMCAIQELALKMGIKPGESMEPALLQYTKEKNIKPLGQTELNKEELLLEAASKNNKIMKVEVDNKGESKYLFINKKDKEND